MVSLKDKIFYINSNVKDLIAGVKNIIRSLQVIKLLNILGDECCGCLCFNTTKKFDYHKSLL